MARKDKKRRLTGGLGHKEKQFLHLKEFSQGKPNEISFNVLEQKAAQQEGANHKKGLSVPLFNSERDAVAGKEVVRSSNDSMVRRGKKKHERKHERRASVSVESPSSFLGKDSQEEIAQRQRRRRVYRRFSIALVAVIVVCLAGVGGYTAYQHYQQLTTSVGVLKEACSLIEKSDETTMKIDAFFQRPFDDDTVTTSQALLEEIPSAREQLESALVYAHKAQGELEGSQRDKEAADRTVASIEARQRLLDAAEQRLQQDGEAKQAIDAMNDAWSKIQEGNSLLAQAAEVVSDTTNDNVSKSTEYTTQANAAFAEAKTSLEAAKKFSPSAKMDAAEQYVAKKQTAAAEALQSNAAILIQDKQTAESHNDAYNKADAEAVELAKSLPKNFAQPVIDAYASSVQQYVDAYETARSDAAGNDDFLRDYLASV